jgi:hypothetical protein
MGLDIRLPLGLLFGLLGLMLIGYGLASDAAIYERALGLNINLWWGLAMTAFGLVFAWLGRRGTSPSPEESPSDGFRGH